MMKPHSEPYIVRDPLNGITWCDSEADALEWAAKVIPDYHDGQEWSDEVEGIWIARITHRIKEIAGSDASDGEPACDYRMEPAGDANPWQPWPTEAGLWVVFDHWERRVKPVYVTEAKVPGGAGGFLPWYFGVNDGPDRGGGCLFRRLAVELPAPPGEGTR